MPDAAPGFMKTDVMLELAERCEDATGPDRELDEEIAAAVAGAVREVQSDGRSAFHTGDRWVSVGAIQPFTASLDAAMTLVPEGWQGDRMCWWAGSASVCELIETHQVSGQWVREAGWLGRAGGKAATPVLALCAAALRARAAA